MGTLFRKFKSNALYGGLDRETFRKYTGNIMREDVRNLNYYILFCAFGFLALTIASLLTSGFAHVNTKIYAITAASFFVLFGLKTIIVKAKGDGSKLNYITVVLFMGIMYFESIALTLLHPNVPAVTYIGLLLILPLIFAERPLSMLCIQSVFVVIFCVLTRQYKPADIAAMDIWNGVSFLVVSFVASMVIIPMRINLIIQPEITRALSESDLLTQLKNRNKYEMDCQAVDQMDRRPAVIYADANGLHNLNNSQGHEAGDKLLKAVALEMKNAFGSEYSYRVGGDEFISFRFDLSKEEIDAKIVLMNANIKRQGYSASVGYARPANDEESIYDIVKRAEKEMYAKKSAYYESLPADQRTR